MVGSVHSQIAGEVVEVCIERGVESAFLQRGVLPVHGCAAEVARVIFSRLAAEEAGVEEAFEAGAPIDEVALGKLDGGNNDATAANLSLGKESASVWQCSCALSQIELDA